MAFVALLDMLPVTLPSTLTGYVDDTKVFKGVRGHYTAYHPRKDLDAIYKLLE